MAWRSVQKRLSSNRCVDISVETVWPCGSCGHRRWWSPRVAAILATTGAEPPATTADGRKVWFRGRRNLDAMLGFLRDEHGNFDIIFDPFSAFSQPCAAPTRAV